MYTPKRLKADGWEVTYARTTTNLFFHNAMQLGDLLLSGILPRYPDLKFVSVESGIGWIPFLLDSVDYHFRAAGVGAARSEFKMMPSEYFHRQVYGCYWFEKDLPSHLLETVGASNILFETDFPHVTCLFGDAVDHAIDVGLGRETASVRRKILFENCARLYNVELPA